MANLIQVGFFRELKHGDPKGPSLRAAVANAAAPDEAKIVAYLKAGQLYIGSPGIVKDVMDPKAGIIGSPDILTDGTYAWPADFAYYVEKYHARAPEELVQHMARAGWRVPTNIPVAELKL